MEVTPGVAIEPMSGNDDTDEQEVREARKRQHPPGEEVRRVSLCPTDHREE